MFAPGGVKFDEDLLFGESDLFSEGGGDEGEDVGVGGLGGGGLGFEVGSN